jgi:uncharacterized surface protein with fasciclin (FAS1) repeats
MRSRTLSILALVTATTFGLAACGSESASTDTTVAVAPEGETTETSAATEDPAATETSAAAAAETTPAETTPAATETTPAAAETTVPADGGATTVAAATGAAGEADIVDTAVAAGNFTILAKLLTDAGLVETLKGEGPFTVFAPTDEAFAAVPPETLASLSTDKELLKKVLTYHVVAGKVLAADVKAGEVPTVAGPNITIKVDGGKVMVNDANVTAVDVLAKNGVIHVLDKVLLPPSA